MTSTVLRVSLTGKCNLSCVYCNPRQESLELEEVVNFVKAFARLSSALRIRLSGGEPLLWDGLEDLIPKLRGLSVGEIALTTNGTLLAERIDGLGSNLRVNVSLDSVDPKIYARITGKRCLGRVLDGLEAALEVGMFVKTNTVVLRGVNYGTVHQIIDFCARLGVVPRFIERIPSGDQEFVSTMEVLRWLRTLGSVAGASSPPGWGPARYYSLDGKPFGLISTSDPPCFSCKRLRIGCDGNLYLCLYSKPFANLREAPDLRLVAKEALRTKLANPPCREVREPAMALVGA